MQKINAVKRDSKEFWKTRYEIMGRRTTGGASFVESEGMLLTKPSDIAVNKIYALRQNMDNTDSDYKKLITNNVMLEELHFSV